MQHWQPHKQRFDRDSGCFGSGMKFLFLIDSLLLPWLWNLLHFWSLPHPSGYFPSADARISMNLHLLFTLSLGLISLCHKTLNLQVQLDVPAYGFSYSPVRQQGPASPTGSPNSHPPSLLFKVMPWPFHFSICKHAKLAVQNQLWLFCILFPGQGRKLTGLALSLSSLSVFTQKFLSSIQFFPLAFPSCSVEHSGLAERVDISNNNLYITREQQMSCDP